MRHTARPPASTSRLHLPPPPPASTSPHPHPHLPPFSVWPLSVLVLCAAGGVSWQKRREENELYAVQMSTLGILNGYFISEFLLAWDLV